MKITVENTDKIVKLVVDGVEVPARIWEGTTESGTPCHCYITRIAPTIDKMDKRNNEFARELLAVKKPTAALESIPLRMIL